MPLILPSNSISALGYNVDNSLRFDDGSSDNLSRNTWGTATNDKIFTMSVWVKRSGLGYQQIVNSYDGSTGNDNQLKFQSTDAIELTVSTGTEYFLKTNRLFRDVSAWYHIVFAFDSTQATASDRYKLYVNGTQETSFSSVSYPPQNTTYQFFRNSNANNIGSQWGASGGFFDGYMGEFCFIDGQALDPTSFGEFDEDSGIWIPIDVSGLTFGTNGFYLDFENSGSLGADVSGNGNNFTVNNLTSIDQTTDTPTNNYATLNPLDIKTAESYTFSDGNTKMTSSSLTRSTIAVDSGKWYCEVKCVSTTAWNGVIDMAQTLENGISTNSIALYVAGATMYIDGLNQGSGGYGSAWSSNDIMLLALDLDSATKKIYFGKNGGWWNGSDYSAGSPTTGETLDANITYGFTVGSGSGSVTNIINFGNPAFTISSGNSDGNGKGNFEYAVPSGYFALCTSNLAEHG